MKSVNRVEKVQYSKHVGYENTQETSGTAKGLTRSL